jgi:hypothetical protein
VKSLECELSCLFSCPFCGARTLSKENQVFRKTFRPINPYLLEPTRGCAAGLLESRVLERDRQLAAGRSRRSNGVYWQDVLLPLQFETEFAQDREDCGEAGEGVHGRAGRGGSRMGAQPSVFTVNSPLSAVRFTTGKSADIFGLFGSKLVIAQR